MMQLFFKDDFVTLTVDEILEDILDCAIESWSGYGELIIDILKLPYPTKRL
jgi:hypothetical protein